MNAAGYPLAPDPSVEWAGATRRYDLVKEAVFALLVVTGLVLVLSAVFSSPDVKPVTVASWASTVPKDFLATALSELDGTSASRTYGPPYTHVAGAGQNVIGGLSLQRSSASTSRSTRRERLCSGRSRSRRIRIRPSRAALLAYEPRRRRDSAWRGRTRTRRRSTAERGSGKPHAARVRAGADADGHLLAMARSGGLDAALISTGRFYQSNFTKSLLFLADGSYLEDARRQAEPAREPVGDDERDGQLPRAGVALALHVLVPDPALLDLENADAQIWGLMAILSLAFVLVPFIPGVRSIPTLGAALPADLARLLPEGAGGWPCASVRNVSAAQSRSAIVCAADICASTTGLKSVWGGRPPWTPPRRSCA